MFFLHAMMILYSLLLPLIDKNQYIKNILINPHFSQDNLIIKINWHFQLISLILQTF